MFSWQPSLGGRREELRQQIIERGKKREHGATHGLGDGALRTIVATSHFLLKDGDYIRQVEFDLLVAEYKVWDWIAMLLDGRDDGNERLTQVMTSAYLRSNDVEGFIHNLRTRDYQVEEPILEPIADGDGDRTLTLEEKGRLLESARGEPEVRGDDWMKAEWWSDVYGDWLPVKDVIGLCPACGEPVVEGRMDQELAARKQNHCGYCGFEADDDELVKAPRKAA